MPANQNNKKLSNRRKKSDNEKLGIHSAPSDIVEIERNLVENWMIGLKHWLHINPSTARKIIFGVLIGVVMFFLFIFIYSIVTEKQNSQYYSILLSYEKLKEDSAVKIDPDKLKKLQEHANKLCNNLWSTRYSNNGCLLAAILSNEADNKKDAAEFLEKFSKKANNNALAAYTTFLSGYFYETGHDLEHSGAMYKKLDSYVDDKNGKDFTLFHKGRLFYYNDDLVGAEKTFKEIIEKYKSGAYYTNARNYLLLIQLKKAQPSPAKNK
jgi:predicted negative regulator of RcsB-dependent stress response